MTNANLYALFRVGFSAKPNAIGIQTPDRHNLTFAAIEAASARYANLLTESGVVSGDRVAVQVEKSPQALVLYLACLRAGAVYMPLNPACSLRESAYFLRDASPRLMVASPVLTSDLAVLCAKYGVTALFSLDAAGNGSLITASRNRSDHFATVISDADDLAVLLYTSGTTGQPKAAMLTHANLVSNVFALHTAWGFEPDDVLLHMLPLFHTHGLFVACNTALLNATPMLFCAKFDAGLALQLLPRSTVFMGVPTFYARMLRQANFGAAHCANMRLFTSGSAPLPESTFQAFRDRTGHTILERYGMTECGISTSNPLHQERRPGTVGLPLADVSLRVIDDHGQPLPAGEVGAVEFTGPNVFNGYWRNPQKTAASFTADGYFKSGDLGLVDDAGYLRLVGRSNDLVISGGFNVYPKEVEEIIDGLPEINESAVIGIADADLGEQVIAIVVPRINDQSLTEATIIAALKTDLVHYKVPKRIFITEQLPRNAMGKVQKNILRETYAELAGRYSP